MTPFRGIADFWPNFNSAAIFGHFHIVKSDKSKNFSGYGLYKYIGEEKIHEKMTSQHNIPPRPKLSNF